MLRSPFIQDPLSRDSSGSKSNRSVSHKFSLGVSVAMVTSEAVPPLCVLLPDNPQDNICEPSCHHTRVEAESGPGRHRKSECSQTGQKHLLPVQNPSQQLPWGLCCIPAPGERFLFPPHHALLHSYLYLFSLLWITPVWPIHQSAKSGSAQTM